MKILPGSDAAFAQMIGPMQGWQSLPDAALTPANSITSAFFSVGARTYQEAARLVYRLPYGRTSSRDNPMAVLTEGCGTCSTKHALLAELATEQRLPVALMLGIYLMNERNTPGVGGVLMRHGLAEIPEAHCYLIHDGVRIDITRAITCRTEAIAALLHEEQIVPAQVSLYKVRLHKDFLRNWLQTMELGKSLTFDDLWRVREECIAALALPQGQEPGRTYAAEYAMMVRALHALSIKYRILNVRVLLLSAVFANIFAAWFVWKEQYIYYQDFAEYWHDTALLDYRELHIIVTALVLLDAC